jgi:hypothetical protein
MTSRKPEAAFAAVEAELLAEAAQSLGLAGTRLDRTLAALAACPRERDELRHELFEAASAAAYAYIVQREAMGMTDSQVALDVYGVPAEVRAAMGRHRPPPPVATPEDPVAYFTRLNTERR